MPVPTTIHHVPDPDTILTEPITTITTKPDTYCHFLSLPLELRLQIYTPLLTPSSTDQSSPLPNPLPILPLFIRAHVSPYHSSPPFTNNPPKQLAPELTHMLEQQYKTLFMCQHPTKSIYLPLLRIARQITAECLPILYGLPLWRACCRIEQLASQIGPRNFGFIRRMEVDVDDLGSVLGSLRGDSARSGEVGSSSASTDTDGNETRGLTSASSRRLRFTNLEELRVEGYQTLAPTARGSKASRIEARMLCFTAIALVSAHPTLSVLVQVGRKGDLQDSTNDDGIGGADARDMTLGRVKWRFLRNVKDMDVEKEYVVDLVGAIALFDSLIGMDEAEEQGREDARWRGGVYVQYPYLRRM